jgi:hypothetical protein
VSAEKTAGLIASQAKGRSSATSMRNTHKGRNRKIVIGIMVVAVLIVLLIAFRDYNVKQKEVAVSSSTVQSNKSKVVGTAPQIGTVTTVDLTLDCTDAVNIPAGTCITNWQYDGPVLNYKTQVIPQGKTEWVSFEKFIADQNYGGAKAVSKMRWCGTGIVAYEIRKDGKC